MIMPKEELDMMKNPNKWPQWPVLPLIRRTRGESPGYEGILFDDPKVRFTVYHGNIFMDLGHLESCPQKVYASFEEILADGWAVD
jgi:hypothetical protein